MLGDADAQLVQARPEVGAGRAGVVGEKREATSRTVQRLERLTRAGVEDAAVPDTAVEVEDEALEAGERAQASADRRSSAIASR